MASYQGHRSWAAWNVSLWINNDESLYTFARELVRFKCRRNAARVLMESLPPRTPDGARYTLTSVIEALRGIDA
jgi:hypothetical protein